VRLPAKPSAGYLAFMGKQKTYQLVLGHSLLQILNYRDRYGEVLTLQLVPMGNGKREQAASSPISGSLDAVPPRITLRTVHSLAESIVSEVGPPAGYLAHRQNLSSHFWLKRDL
jgi:hypothetical protein